MRAANVVQTLAVLITMLLSLGTITAQTQEEGSFEGFIHGIRVNAVKGDATYQHDDVKFPLERGLKLTAGDFIRTAPNSYAELLLQPGNYLRIAGDTEIQIINDEHDRMRLKLNRGSINLEILSRENLNTNDVASEAHYLIRVITAGTGVFITQPGVFRVSAIPPGPTELIVRNGEAVMKGREVKAKRRAVASNEGVTINEIDSKLEDDFDLWARERADAMVRANKELKKTTDWAKKSDEQSSVDFPEEDGRSSSHLIVSAKPGAVTFVEPGVEFSRKPNEWLPLTEKTNLQVGDRLRTDAISFAELELFPDMHFRLADASEMVFEELSNDGVSVRIVSGSAILDVAARFDRKQAPPITISSATTSAKIADTGNYRIDVNAITVRGGKVTFKERSVGSCRIISSEGISDCDKRRSDDFDYWSRNRGEGEYESGLSMAGYFARLRRLRFRNAGFWFQTPGEPSYTFVPFTSEMFRSPYGGNYSTALSPRRRLNPSRWANDRLPHQSPPRPSPPQP